MIITFTEQNAIFQMTAFVSKSFCDDYYLCNYLNNKRSIKKKGNHFPPFPVIISLCLKHSQHVSSTVFAHQCTFPRGSGTEVNKTLIGIFFKAHKTLNWRVAAGNVTLPCRPAAPFKRPFIRRVLMDQMRALTASGSLLCSSGRTGFSLHPLGTRQMWNQPPPTFL